jgi:uncharacterized protein
MSGETNLQRLLAEMEPKLGPETYVFATVLPGAAMPAGIDTVMTFREADGTTLILREAEARAAGLSGTFRSRLITLEIHSSLDAVGFLAAITRRLADAGMGVNPVSAYFHDHLFVPADRADEAMALLRRLAEEAASGRPKSRAR